MSLKKSKSTLEPALPNKLIPIEEKITAADLKASGLTDEELKKIVRILDREPNRTELGIFGVMWSEHCSYKSSRIHLKQLPTQGPFVLQGPGENAGIIDIGEGWVAVFKIESHNHPSFIEPFQGAATGVGGILRDIFTMGARPVAVLDSLRFGSLSEPQNQGILRGVVSGIAHYGNCFGVANLGGETRFEDCYAANPLVNAFALGVARREAIFYGQASGVGNTVMYVGAKTGRDGIHGATMASEEFCAASESKRPNVQVGDPFLEKLLLEACLEAMASGAILGIQDMGAAGLTSSSSEMGGRAGTGVDLDLDRVPQRETGMSAYELMLSESQERMLLVSAPGREAEISAIFAKWGLDAVAVGKVIAEPMLRVRQHGRLMAELPNDALTNAAPRYDRPAAQPVPDWPRERPTGLRDPEPGEALLRLLASPELASKRWIYEQYDTSVRTNTLLAPGADAGVIRLKDTHRGLAISLEGNGRYCRLDPRQGARLAVAEAARNVAVTGAMPVAATNCLNFANPEKPEVMWQFRETIAGLAESCKALGTPITGGNVSFYNETMGNGIYPTPIVGIVGIIDLGKQSNRSSNTTLIDVLGAALPIQSSFQHPGNEIWLLSGAPAMNADETARRFGSSEYVKTVLGALWGEPPALDLQQEAALHKLLRETAAQGWLASAHDISSGGLAVALAECLLAHPINHPPGPLLGLECELSEKPAAENLFGETASRVIISCRAEHAAKILAASERCGLRAHKLGRVTREPRFILKFQGRSFMDFPVSDMVSIWSQGLSRWLEPAANPDSLNRGVWA